MTKKNDWFRVHKEGLAQVYARRGPAAPFFELVSNAWDEEGVTKVELEVTAVPGKAEVTVFIVDDSTHGFRDLDEARTLFAPSYKKAEAQSRGRFNVGEKLFLSLCRSARIVSTGGALEFKSDGTVRRSKSPALPLGTEVHATLRMTRAEMDLAFAELRRLRTPAGIETTITFDIGGDIDSPDPDHVTLVAGGGEFSFEAKLQSELADDAGVLRPTERVAAVQAWVVEAEETGWLYELGIPVVEIGGMFDINVLQKVPLTVDRDNVKPAFLRRLRAHMLNHGFRKFLTKGDASEAWVTDAMGSTNPPPSRAALEWVLDLRFGKKRVIYDPSDREGSQIAMSQGYAVVPGGSLPSAVWANVKSTRTMLPAGQVTPSKSDKAAPSKAVRPEDIEGGVEVVAAYKRLAKLLIGCSVQVTILESAATVLADYGGRKIRLNLQQLGRAWFKKAVDNGELDTEHVELLIHELGHEFSSSHLDEGYHRSQTRLGVKLAFLAVASGADLFRIESAVAGGN